MPGAVACRHADSKGVPYPTDVSDQEEWTFVAPYLALVCEDAPESASITCARYNDALKWIVRAGAPWRMLPHTFPPWEASYQKTQSWPQADLFEAMVPTCAPCCA